MLDGAGARAAGRIWSASRALSCCLHASIAVGRVSKRRPITVIPPVASLPGNRVTSIRCSCCLRPCTAGRGRAALEWLGW